jgi:RND family efflux transporter MFP subunit
MWLSHETNPTNAMIRFFPNLSPTRHFVPLLLLTLALRGVMASTHAAEEPATVLTVIAEKSEGILRTLSLTGTVTARREARLSSRATGLVMEMRVDEGDIVKKGDVLMTLDTDLAGITLEGIRAEIARSRVQLDEAKRQEEEVRELVKSGSFPKSDAETRKSTVLVNEANLQQLLVREREQIEMIARHQLVAPFSGVISRKLSEEGEWVPTGTPVLELVETEKPRFDLQVPQEFLARVSGAEKVVVHLDAHPEIPIEAHIATMVPVKDIVSRTFLTRLEFDDERALAAPGMSGTAGISFRPRDGETVQIPRDAVVRYPDGKVMVWIVSKSGEETMVKSREIKTGGSLGELTEVLSGLEGGEQIVLKGNESLWEDQAVKLSEPKKKATAATAP